MRESPAVPVHTVATPDGRSLEVFEAVRAGLGLASVGQTFDGIDVLTDEFGVELHALVRVNAGFADLLHLGFAERIVMLFLCEGADRYQHRDSDCGGKIENGTHAARDTLRSIQSHGKRRGNEHNSGEEVSGHIWESAAYL